MKQLFIFIFVNSFFNFCLATPSYFPKKFFVKVRDHHLLPSSNLIQKTKHLFLNYYLIETNYGDQLINEFRSHPAIQSITKNQYHTQGRTLISAPLRNKRYFKYQSDFELAFNDKLYSEQWHFLNARYNGVSANEVYLSPLLRKESPTVVAVLDSGVDIDHTDLQGNIWTNLKEIADNGIDDDDNGHIDDVHGINTFIRDSDNRPTTNIQDLNQHGTIVAGIIGAVQNNFTGIAGLSSRVQIMPMVIFDEEDESDADVIEALLYAAKQGAKIINCSFVRFTTNQGDMINETINYIGREFGVLVIAASGNRLPGEPSRDIDLNPVYPASFDSDFLLTVAATDGSGDLANFSYYGKEAVDIAAPGTFILSTIPQHQYKTHHGTSLAAPIVSAIAAELNSRFPEFSPLDIKRIILDSATQSSSLANHIKSGGAVNLKAALDLALSLATKKNLMANNF